MYLFGMKLNTIVKQVLDYVSRLLFGCSIGSNIQVGSVKDTTPQLPEDIFLCILSFMTLKEAARMSVISPTWRELCCFSLQNTSTLDFDASATLRFLRHSRGRESEFLLTKARQSYVDWVNLVVKSHKGSTLDLFRVKFDLDTTYSRDIDTWVQFAIQKKVKYLTMDFYRYYHGRHAAEDTYSCSSLLQSCNTDCSFLQKLYLRCVNIDGTLIEHLISSCPHLEELAIIRSHSLRLVHLNIAGPLLCLKHLKIVFCSNLKSILLSATNLSSFEYRGRAIDISYNNVPNIVKMSMGLISGKYDFPSLPSFLLRRLETLKLRLARFESRMAEVKFPELPHLKNLKLVVRGGGDLSILNYASLIEAAPSLCKLEIEMHFMKYQDRQEREAKKAELRCPLRCLKEIEIVGFEGHATETELVEYLLENAIILEKVIIDCLPPRLAYLPATNDFFKKSVDDIRKHVMPHIEHFKSRYSLGEKLLLRNF